MHPEGRQVTSLELRFAVRTVGATPTEQDLLLGSWPDRRHGAGNLERLLEATDLREGTPEWEIEYPRVVAALKRQKGLV